ncbi:MAG: SPFH domain-containing protein [Propionibacteriaceae bacterium]|nr:SPFH/Band 7/PHB domain protein [Micropruina sp.]HBY22994.1 SPFH/Band 7/PHB domain protein [Propionibacteriaceae bacterium]
MPAFIIPLILLIVAIAAVWASVRLVRQQQVAIVERLGKFRRTLAPGPHLLMPMVDTVRYTMDMREMVVPFPPQGVITEDNLMVSIDSVIYFQIVDPVKAAYEAQNYIQAIEQLTMTTLRNIIGGMDLEQTLTSREEINAKLRAVLDEATGKWGIKVNRVELRSVEPPATIRDAMEKGARAERDKRAAILLAEGQRQSQILSASGERESLILRAQGERESQVLRAQAERQSKMLRAEGEAQAITTVFNAIHAGQPDQALLAYQYMQMLPQIAQGTANKVWVIPSEVNEALKGLGKMAGDLGRDFGATDPSNFAAPAKVDVFAEIAAQKAAAEAESRKTVQDAINEAQLLETNARRRLASPEEQLAIDAAQFAAPTSDVAPVAEPEAQA